MKVVIVIILREALFLGTGVYLLFNDHPVLGCFCIGLAVIMAASVSISTGKGG